MGGDSLLPYRKQSTARVGKMILEKQFGCLKKIIIIKEEKKPLLRS